MADTAVMKNEANGFTRPEADGVTVTPRVDILERDDELLLLVDLPGVKPGDVDVRFEQGELVLHGRRTGSGREAVGYHRAFRLGDAVAADRISADLRDGVLTLHLPKVERVKPRRIAINGA